MGYLSKDKTKTRVQRWSREGHYDYAGSYHEQKPFNLNITRGIGRDVANDNIDCARTYVASTKVQFQKYVECVKVLLIYQHIRC